MNKLNIDTNLRPQNLEPETYYKLANEYNKLRSSAGVSPRPRRIEQFLDQLNEQEGKVKIIKIDTHSPAKYIEEHNHILV